MNDFFDSLQSIYPSDRFLTSDASRTSFESDGLTAFAVRPRAVVIPESERDVIATVKACHAHRIPFVARGSGTSLSGGSLPNRDGIIIALNRMNRIIDLNPDKRVISLTIFIAQV